jgi:hydrogenase maturation factor
MCPEGKEAAMSKFSLDVLQKRVFPFAGVDDPDVLLGAAFGEDVALTRVGGEILVSHVDPIAGAIGDIGWLAVHVACNDVATAGIPPRWLLLLVLVPRMEDEELLEQIMRDANPIPSIVSCFAQAFQFDPLRMISSGTLAVTVPPERVEGVSRALGQLGTAFAFVGGVVEGAGVRVLQNGKAVHYTEIRCEEDESARMWALYPRDE